MGRSLKLGEAIIESCGSYWLLTFVRQGSFLKGEREFQYYAQAAQYCRGNGLKLVNVGGY